MATLSKTTAKPPVTPLVGSPDQLTANKAPTPSPVVATVGSNAALEYVAKIGEATYKLSRGEILVRPIAPEVRCATRKFSQVRFVVLDENATLFAKFRQESDVTVSIGFQGGKIVEKFKGKIKNVGRVEPFGTLIIAIDNLAQLGNTAAPGTSDAGVIPPADGRKTEVDRSKRKVSKTLSYAKLEKSKLVKGAKFKDNTAYDPTALVVFSTSIPAKSTVTISVPGGTDFVDAVVATAPGGATNTLVLSEAAYTKASALANKDKKPFKLEIYTLPAETPATKTASTTEQAVLDSTKLKYSKQTPYAPNKDGGATLQQTAGQKIVKDAAAVGNVVVATGNTVKEISADQGNQAKTNLILDYKYGKSAFVGEPIITVKTPLVVNSGVGTLTVNGWNLNNKEAIVATTATQPSDGTTPGVKVFASPTGPIKPGDLIYPGSMYTWGDATKGGARVPETPEVYQGIIRIAQILTQYTQKVGKGKWTITSWYRRRADNPPNGAKNSQHLTGCAADFSFPGMAEFYEKVRKEWPGGVAIMYGSFVHLDDRLTGRHPNPATSAKTGEPGRWIYGGGGKAI